MSSFKRNQEVRWTRKNGDKGVGKFAGREEKANGEWALIKVEGQKVPTKVRMSQLSVA